jgi:hypothetical protein
LEAGAAGYLDRRNVDVHSQSALGRAFKETSAKASTTVFATVSVLVAAVAALISFSYVNDAAQPVLLRAVIAGAVVLGGFLLPLIGLFLLALLSAPYQQRDEARHEIRRQGELSDFVIKPYARGSAIHLEVRNNGPVGEFGAKVMLLAGVGQHPDPPWEIAWRDRPGEPLRRIGQNDSEILGLCDCSGSVVDFATPHDSMTVWLKGAPNPNAEGWKSEEAVLMVQVYRNDPWVGRKWGLTFYERRRGSDYPEWVPVIGRCVPETER